MLLLDGSDPQQSPSDLLEQQMVSILDAIEITPDFSFAVEADNGRRFVYERGTSTLETVYNSASTAKLVTSSIFMWHAQNSNISLDAKPQDFLSYWPTTGNHADITLQHLLSFTSGLNESAGCMFLPNISFDLCIRSILELNPMPPSPGSEFFYNNAHMQVAGAMLIGATDSDNWSEVFDEFKSTTGLFANATYSIPSSNNPMLAGGMTWTGNEYLNFLESLYRGQLLLPEYFNLLFSDQISTASIISSPTIDTLDEDWHYGLGVWVECRSQVFNCSEPFRYSSPGSFGAYPFIDDKHNYFGMVVRQGDLFTSDEGIAIFRSVETLLEQWSELNR